MTPSDFLYANNWLIALTVMVGVISWAVLVLQALLHDKRIALVGVFGSLLFSFTFLLPEIVPEMIKWLAAIICVLFFIWFLLKNYTQPAVYLSALGIVLSSVSAWWVYSGYQALL